MLEIFVEYLDGIYWEGYANQLANENTDAFNSEYTQFTNNYNTTND